MVRYIQRMHERYNTTKVVLQRGHVISSWPITWSGFRRVARGTILAGYRKKASGTGIRVGNTQ